VIACDSQKRLPLPLWTSSPILPIVPFHNSNALVLSGGANLGFSNVWLLIYSTGRRILSNVRSCYRNKGCYQSLVVSCLIRGDMELACMSHGSFMGSHGFEPVSSRRHHDPTRLDTRNRSTTGNGRSRVVHLARRPSKRIYVHLHVCTQKSIYTPCPSHKP
jgi:hypothetical protein